MVCISLDKNTNEGLAWTKVALSVPGACFVFLFFSSFLCSFGKDKQTKSKPRTPIHSFMSLKSSNTENEKHPHTHNNTATTVLVIFFSFFLPQGPLLLLPAQQNSFVCPHIWQHSFKPWSLTGLCSPSSLPCQEGALHLWNLPQCGFISQFDVTAWFWCTFSSGSCWARYL